MEKRKLINKLELSVLTVIVLLFGVWFCFNKYQTKNEKVAIIEKNGAVIHKINLSKVKEPYTINIDAKYHSTIFVEKDKISFQDAKCPDKLCQKAGKISEQNQTAICLPSKISIRIEGAESKVDGVTG